MTKRGGITILSIIEEEEREKDELLIKICPTAMEKIFLEETVIAIIEDTQEDNTLGFYERIGKKIDKNESTIRKKVGKIIKVKDESIKKELDFKKTPTPKQLLDRLAEKFKKGEKK